MKISLYISEEDYMNGGLFYLLKSIVILISNTVEKKMKFYNITKSTKSDDPKILILIYSHAMYPRTRKCSDSMGRENNRCIACL